MQPTTLDQYNPASPIYRFEENPCTEDHDMLIELRDMINEKLQDESAADICENELDILGKYRVKWYKMNYYDIRIIDDKERTLHAMQKTDEALARIVRAYYMACVIDDQRTKVLAA